MNHEEARAKKVKRIVGKEEKEPIYIKEEKINSSVVINNHNIISNDAKTSPRYVATQELDISHFYDTL